MGEHPPLSGLIIVSNRLPYSLRQNEQGEWEAHSSAGGLVTAMEPVLRQHGGTWIGWPGTTDTVPNITEVLDKATEGAGFKTVPVLLSERQRDQFYYGYSNEVIWPLFHDLQSHCNFDPSYWQTYKEVNAKFAEAVFTHASEDDLVWVHDYQLINMGQALRDLGCTNRLAFFLHIPFPPLDIFEKLPQQQRILDSLLQYDVIGFQTRRDQRNFVECVRRLERDSRVTPHGSLHHILWRSREIRAGSFPIGIDFDDFVARTASEEVSKRAWNIHAGLPDRQLILGVDRLDYTKGIPERLRAFGHALERYPELLRNVTFIQVVVPSRTDIPKYDTLKTEIEQLVGMINGRFSQAGYVPIHYTFGSLDPLELLAYYRTCEIVLVTPLKDGMNLVAKEYCACTLEENGVLILSQFAGASDQLRRGALLVNPYDIEQVGDAIFQAFKMHRDERRTRMRKLRDNIRKENVFWWVDSFFKAALDPHPLDDPTQ